VSSYATCAPLGRIVHRTSLHFVNFRLSRGADWLDARNVCPYAGRMAAVSDGDATNSPGGLDHWRDGETVARIVWIDREGAEHEDLIFSEREALNLLNTIAGDLSLHLVLCHVDG
jgi:hypothetical protein